MIPRLPGRSPVTIKIRSVPRLVRGGRGKKERTCQQRRKMGTRRCGESKKGQRRIHVECIVCVPSKVLSRFLCRAGNGRGPEDLWTPEKSLCTMIAAVWFVFATLFVAIYIYFKDTYRYWQVHGVPFLEPSFPFGNFRYGMTAMSSGEVMKSLYEKAKGKTVAQDMIDRN